jgi:hypothetical protein
LPKDILKIVSSLSSAVVEEEERQVSLAVELSLKEAAKENQPPKVPPHRHLTTTSKSIPKYKKFNVYSKNDLYLSYHKIFGRMYDTIFGRTTQSEYISM